MTMAVAVYVSVSVSMCVSCESGLSGTFIQILGSGLKTKSSVRSGPPNSRFSQRGYYGVAATSRLLKLIVFFCKRDL